MEQLLGFRAWAHERSHDQSDLLSPPRIEFPPPTPLSLGPQPQASPPCPCPAIRPQRGPVCVEGWVHVPFNLSGRGLASVSSVLDRGSAMGYVMGNLVGLSLLPISEPSGYLAYPGAESVIPSEVGYSPSLGWWACVKGRCPCVSPALWLGWAKSQLGLPLLLGSILTPWCPHAQRSSTSKSTTTGQEKGCGRKKKL